jgi:hypothetical protein
MFHAWAEISGSHQAENSTPKSLCCMPGHPKLTTQKKPERYKISQPRSALKANAKTNTATSSWPSQRFNTKGYSPELRRSPVFFDFFVPFSILA